MIILESSPRLDSLQEVYSFIRAHLLEQSLKSSNNARCLLHNGTLACAVGALITNEAYDTDLESNILRRLLSYLHISPKLSNDTDGLLKLLSECLVCHDSFEPEEWKDKLDQIAQNNNLKPE